MRRMMIALLFAALCALSACTFAPAQSIATAVATPTTVRVIQTTPVPTYNRQLQSVPTPSDVTATPDPTPIVASCEGAAGQPQTRHTVEATLAFRQQIIEARQTITYINRSNGPLEQIVFNVEPNRRTGVFTLNAFSIGADTPVPAYELTGRRLTADLPEPLGPGCSIEFRLDFRIRIPQIGVGDDGFSGYFGFGARQINLAHWLPNVAARQNGDWLLHDNLGVGEQTVFDPADWDVTLRVEGASDKLMVVGPGEVFQPEPGVWRFVHRNARDIALSMSEHFNRHTAETETGVTVELYTFDDAVVDTAGGPQDGAAHALQVATRSLSMYSDLFGDYPHERFIVVQGDFPDGMEFSDLVFVSTNWFRGYTGSPEGYLTIITVHEVAHQWWYSRVGNDQASSPWLDEALATYSEYIFYEEYYPDLKDWWWRFRVNTWIPEDFNDQRLTSSVYEFDNVREYINAVYLRGARMLHDLRRDLGTQAFFDWLRRYADAGAGRIATPDLFWSLLTPEQLERTRQTREKYLGSPEPEVASAS